MKYFIVTPSSNVSISNETFREDHIQFTHSVKVFV